MATLSIPTVADFSILEKNGQTAVVVPSLRGWAYATTAFTANRGFFSRFVLLKDRTISSIMFRTITVGTNNIDVGIIDSAGARLASSGTTAGKKAANTNQTIALTASVNLTAGTVYYAGISSDTTDGTCAAASILQGMELFFGSTMGLVEGFYMSSGCFPIPTTVTLGATNAGTPAFGLL